MCAAAFSANCTDSHPPVFFNHNLAKQEKNSIKFCKNVKNRMVLPMLVCATVGNYVFMRDRLPVILFVAPSHSQSFLPKCPPSSCVGLGFRHPQIRCVGGGSALDAVKCCRAPRDAAIITTSKSYAGVRENSAYTTVSRLVTAAATLSYIFLCHSAGLVWTRSKYSWQCETPTSLWMWCLLRAPK